MADRLFKNFSKFQTLFVFISEILTMEIESKKFKLTILTENGKPRIILSEDRKVNFRFSRVLYLNLILHMISSFLFHKRINVEYFCVKIPKSRKYVLRSTKLDRKGVKMLFAHRKRGFQKPYQRKDKTAWCQFKARY